MKEEMFFTGEELTAAREYWLAQLSGDLEELDLQHGIKVVPEGKKENYQLEFPADLCERIFAVCKDRDLLLYILLMAVFKLSLFKYGGQEEIIIGSPLYSTSREYYDFNQCIPLIDGINGEMTFRQLLGQVKNTVIESYKNQHYSLEEILQAPGINDRDFNYMKIVVMLENIHNKESIRDIVNSGANEMTVSFIKNRNSLGADISYHSLLYSEDKIRDICKFYLRIFDQVLHNRDLQLKEVCLVTEEERKKLLYEFNDTEADYSQTGTVVDLYSDQVEKAPHRAALNFNHHYLTYNALNKRANQLGRRLNQEGVKPGTLVGMMAIYSLEMIIGIIGILKAGGAYLPIDPGYPGQRIDYMLADAGVEILLTFVLPGMLTGVDFKGKTANLGDPGRYHPDATNPREINTVTDPVYVIYTSGTSGKSKGVLVEHQSLVNYACWKIRAYGFTASDKTLQLISLCFDGFGANLYPALLSGGTLVVPDGSRYGDFKYINRVIEERQVTHMSVVPIMYRACLQNIDKVESIEDDPLKSLRMVVLAGEKPGTEMIELSLARHRHITLINEYGPTEGTVAVAAYWCVTGEKSGVIGKPAANTKIYILDKTNQLQPTGVSGELCISGTPLARGYLNQPGLTESKFKVPGKDGYHRSYRSYRSYILYKTGDRARWHADGNIELLGRIDQQVKIRGYRVEPSEIEAVLLSFETIKEAVVVVKKDAFENNFLCAYFTTGQKLKTSGLREAAAAALPNYMVPSRFIQLDRLPMTRNGKLDREALHSLEINRLVRRHKETGTENFVEAATGIEKQLARIWKEALGVERVGINDNFFELGGNSFLLMQVHPQVDKLYPGCLTITDFFAYTTIARLTRVIEKKQGLRGRQEKKVEIIPVRLPGEYFHDRAEEQSSFDLRFEISGEVLDNMKIISRRQGVELGHMLLAVYIYLFSRVNGESQVVCQAMCLKKDRIIPTGVDLAEIKDFAAFFRLLVQLQEKNEPGGYSASEMGSIKLKKEANDVIPLFYLRGLLPLGRHLPGWYDIVLEVEEQDNCLSFICEFNGRLKEEKVEELINRYVELNELVVRQCLESGERQ